ncbi:hypothetical protein, partial [Candidatus Harpocratesius sp.]
RKASGWVRIIIMVDTSKKPKIKYIIRKNGEYIARVGEGDFKFEFLENIDKITEFGIWDCHFVEPFIDFSSFKKCSVIGISRSDLQEIIKLPANIEEIYISGCKQLKKIDLDTENYKNLKKIGFTNFVLEDWEFEYDHRISTVLRFERTNINTKLIKSMDKFATVSFRECHFIDDCIDFSPLLNCKEFYIKNCDLCAVSGWPPKVEKLDLYYCKNLRNIPLEADQYKYLKKITFFAIFLDNWNIDFSKSYYLEEIFVYEGLAPEDTDYDNWSRERLKNPLPLAPPSDNLPRIKEIPKNWGLCVSLRKLILSHLREIKTIPVEISFIPWLRIELGNCPYIPAFSYLPVQFWNIVNEASDENFDSVYFKFKEHQSRLLKFPELLDERGRFCDETYGLDNPRWTREKTEFLRYMKLVAEQVDDPELKEFLLHRVNYYWPSVRLNDSFKILL